MTPTRTAGQLKLKDAYRQVTDRMAEAAERSGRKASDIVMVAVTKNATPDEIRTVVELGQRDLGENRVQQLQQRVAGLEEFMSRRRTLSAAASSGHEQPLPQVRWHMVGHLQRNKVKPVLPLVRLIHSVDSLRLAEEIQQLASRMDRIIEVLIQVNASGEESKFGVTPPAVAHLAEQMQTMLHVKLRGLMTMAPHSERAEDSRSTFGRCAELFHDMLTSGSGGKEFNILSMGMSGDYEVAIEEGANVIRIGRALFGEPSGDAVESDD